MNRPVIQVEDDDDDDNKILKDGEIYRISSFRLRDSAATDAQTMQDAYAKSVSDLNSWRQATSPSPASVSDATTVADAYQRSVQALNAWRTEQ